jgi:hypothetical protein
VDGVTGKNIQLTTKLLSAVVAIKERVDTMSDTDCDQAGSYLEPIHREFLQAVGKGDRKNNKSDHHKQIRQTFTNFFASGPKINDELVAYAIKNLNETALERVIRLLEIYANVVRNKEYQNYTKPPADFAAAVSDQEITDAYQALELETTEKIDPVSLRHYYLQKRERLYLQQKQTAELGVDKTDSDEESPTDVNSRLEALEAAYLTIYQMLAVTSVVKS